MPNNVLDAFQALLTPDIVGRMASATGESNIAVSKAASAAGPLILTGLAQQAGDMGLMTRIMSLLNSPTVGGNPLGNLSNLFGHTRTPLIEQGAKFLAAIFGNGQNAVVAALSQHAGIRTGSAARILGFTAPIVMTLLGQRVRSENLSVGGLSRLILSLKETLQGIPESMLHEAGLDDLRHAGRASSRPVTAEVPSMRRWGVPASVGLLLLFGLWALVARRQPPEQPVAEGLLDTTPAVLPTHAIPDLGEFARRTLPNGASLNLPGRGVEIQVIEFIEDRSRALEPSRWFNFDRLLFETASATLQPASQEQLQNVADILKAYPAVHLKIGGYTDNTGNPDANLKLSQDRAGIVMNELVRLGVSPERLTAEGYGERHPVASNATEEGRATNRRIAFRVTRR